MFNLDTYAIGLAALLAMAFAAWLASLAQRNLSVADSVWPLLLLTAALVYNGLAVTQSGRAVLVLFLVTVWASRLSIFITLRNWGRPEDRRYRALRAMGGPVFAQQSLYSVFMLQAILAWIISLPLLGAILSTEPLGWLDLLATLIWLAGFIIEAVSDQQLAAFKAHPGSQGRVLAAGLWRYSRHPNYFGECCIWWAFFLFALSASAWWSIIGPVLVTLLLTRIAGIQLAERGIVERRPAYQRYRLQTNAFFPGPPRPRAALMSDLVE